MDGLFQWALLAATVVASLSAAASAYAAFGAIREMRQDRVERNKPVVLIDFDADEKGAVWCTLTNHGNGVANNVQVEFDPIPKDHKERPFSELSWIQNPLSVMPPGKQYRQFFHISGKLLKRPQSDRDFVATVTYQDIDEGHHCGRFRFNFNSLDNLQLPPKSGLYYVEKLYELAKNGKIVVNVRQSES